MKQAAAKPQSDLPVEDPAYDAWARQQIEDALKAKAEARVTYKPLREVAAKYGFHAR